MSHIILARNAYSLNYDCLNTLPYLREQLYQRFGLLAQLKTTLKKKKKKNHPESKHSQRGKNIHLKFWEVITLKRAYGQTLVWVLWRYKRLNKLRQYASLEANVKSLKDF